MRLHHLHHKTTDPKRTLEFYRTVFGATVLSEIPGGGYRLEVATLRINLTPSLPEHTREQTYGFEHLAIESSDFHAEVAELKRRGIRILEERTIRGTKVCWFEGPDGVQFELVESKKSPT